MNQENYLQLSGIQHFAFCERQWALIHIEGLWLENFLTVSGHHLHQRVDDPWEIEKRGDLIVARSVPLVSEVLGLSGKADVVEFHLAEEGSVPDGIILPGRKGRWQPRPVEYKRGRPKKDDRDIVQLCAQAICLEEMLGASIEVGDLFYGETRHREHILLDAALRERVKNLAAEMHRLFAVGKTPIAPPGKNCYRCSLVDVCVPKLTKKGRKVETYIRKFVHDAGGMVEG